MALSRSSRDPGRTRQPSRAAVGRVSLYLRQLEIELKLGHSTISSRDLGAALGITDAQVRKDLACFGQFGHAGIGYRIEELTTTLRRILGIDQDWPTAIIGLGNLGRALVMYRGFRSRGFRVVALLDNDPRKVGGMVSGLKIRPVTQFEQLVAELGVTLAVLCVPAEAAQQVANQVVACGVQGILNFAPVPLSVPAHVAVTAVDLSVQLELLAYQVLHRREGEALSG